MDTSESPFVDSGKHSQMLPQSLELSVTQTSSHVSQEINHVKKTGMSL